MSTALPMSSSNRAELRWRLNNRMVGMAVMGRRQQQTTFQVFDPGLIFDAAACGSTTDLIEDIRGRHGPSWAKLPAQTETLNVLRATSIPARKNRRPSGGRGIPFPATESSVKRARAGLS
jgi:hypothetical protein